MFGKLIKWELKSQKQFLGVCIIIVIVGIVSSVMDTIFNYIGDDTTASLATTLCRVTVVCSAFALLIVWLLMTCTRFRNNLFKDEGYLMHTLPVSAEQLILSKILSPLICLFAALAAIYLEVSFYMKDITGPWDIVYESFGKEFSGMNGTKIAVIILIFLQIIMIICGLYLSVTAGYRFPKNKDVATALIFLLLYALYQMFGVACMLGLSNITADNAEIIPPFFATFIGTVCVGETLAIAICTGYSIYNIKKHLNLE